MPLALVFAQEHGAGFEGAESDRLVTGERVRDKIAASKRKGLWVGGPVPLGYRCLDKKLEIVPEEAETVRTIFSLYLELGSMGALIRKASTGKVSGPRSMAAAMAAKAVVFALAWGRLPISSRTGSTSARSPFGVRRIGASMSRSSHAHCSRPCRKNSPPTPSPGRSGSEVLLLS